MNPKLITWDYNKDATVTLEDALLSFESARFMLGGKIRHASAKEKVTVNLNEEVVFSVDGDENTSATSLPEIKNHLTGNKYAVQPDGNNVPYKYINLTQGTRGQVDKNNPITKANFKNGDHVRIFWTQVVENAGKDEAAEIIISPDMFPGVYKVYGDTFMRSEATGKDEAFQFIIGKAKVLSNTTITLQAEGDPSTFSMTLNVLRSTTDQGETEMIKLVRYGLDESTEESGGSVVP